MQVFYQLANKFTYDAWDAFDIFYVANTKFWQSGTGFTQGAELTLKAAEEIKAGKFFSYSYDHIDVQDIVDAFNVVGIACTKATDWTCTKLP